MHPLLTGFWTTAGPAGVLLFVMFFLHDAKGWDWTALPITPYIRPVMWFLPVIGLGYAWFRTFGTRSVQASQRKRIRRLSGAIAGLCVIFVALYFLLPLVMQPQPPA